jgi:hypothetical protein
LYYAGGPTTSGSSSAFTFFPGINRASERLLEDSATVPADFQKRLRYYSLRKQLRQAAAAGAADAEACTFTPDTGNALQVLALSATRAGNLLETEQASGVFCGCCAFAAGCSRACMTHLDVTASQHESAWLLTLVAHPVMVLYCLYCFVQERYERLGADEAERQAARRAAREAEVYGGLRFQPQLNQRSLAMAPAGSGGVEALANAERRQRRLADLQREEEARQRAECTFQASWAGLAWLAGALVLRSQPPCDLTLWL